MNEVYKKVLRCYESLQKKFDFSNFRPDVAIVLGSGLGDYANDIEVVGEVIESPAKGQAFEVQTKSIKLYSVVPGATTWEQWNGRYPASLIWNDGNYKR